jgi:hypothetical protein
MKRLALILLGAAMAACSAAPNLLPQNDLSRPTDITFGCFGTYPDPADSTRLIVTGRPMEACHPQDAYDPPASATLRTFAFMTESASGGLSVIDADHWKLVDLDPFTAGYGQAPLGELPSQISASQDGCRLVTANRGSCDLSLVDPSVLVAPTFSALQTDQTYDQPSPRTATMTIRPVKGDGTFLASAPYEVAFLPQDTSGLTDPSVPGQACSTDGAQVAPVGWPQPSPPALSPWYALVTYPSCDLVAVVALPGGQIVSSAYVRPVPADQSGTGRKSVTLVPAGPSPVCPVDCVGQALLAGASTGDAGGPDAVPLVQAPGAGDAGATLDGAVDGAPGGIADAAIPDAAATADAGAGGLAGGADGGMAGANGTAGAGGAGGGAPRGGAIPGIQYSNDAYVPSNGPLGPSGIALLPDGTRAYVSLANASYVISVGLTSYGLTLPGNAIYLNEGARGSTRIRLNVDPYRQKTDSSGQVVAGVFVGAEPASASPNLAQGGNQDYGARQYLYAIARDGTVRVISVFLGGHEAECETNLDPLNLPANVTATTACAPVDPAHRRPFSVGPGIHFPALPIDIAAADVRAGPTEDTSEQSVNGAHAWVITDSGAVYLVNINPVLRTYTAAYNGPSYMPAPVQEPLPFANTLRDRNQITYSLTLDPSSGPPRVDVLPSPSSTGPYIEPFWTQGGQLNATSLTNLYVETGVFFPMRPDIPLSSGTDPVDRRAVTPQEWTVTWEGTVAGNRSTGVIQGTDFAHNHFPSDLGTPKPVDSLIQDYGTNFCGSGVVAGDLLTLTGCSQNGQCGLGEQCLLDTTVSSTSAGLPVNGLCVDPNRLDEQAVACAPFLQTVRRYKIVAAYPNQVVIRPHLDELVRSVLTPCTPAGSSPGGAGGAGGAGGMGGAANGGNGGAASSADSCPDPNDPSTRSFTCQMDPEAAAGAPRRCLMKCDDKTTCRAGRVCVRLMPTQPPTSPDSQTTLPTTPKELQACGQSGDCYCADAPPLTDDAKSKCFDQLTSYQVQVGSGFLVSGSQSGFSPTAALPPSGDKQCNPSPTTDPRFTFRIPMNAPVCTEAGVDWNKVKTIDGRNSPPVFTAGQPPAATDAQNNANTLVAIPLSAPSADPCLYLGGPVVGDPPASTSSTSMTTPPTHVRALFRNSQISFVLANLDRAPSGQFAISFDVHGGFNAQLVQAPPTVEVSMPARIFYGPVDALTQVTGSATPPTTEQRYLFVVDQRRLGHAQGGGPTRGQLLRIHPLGYTSTVGAATGTQPIFQDYNNSGGLFPIQ